MQNKKAIPTPEQIAFFKDIVNQYEPYPIEEYLEMSSLVDGKGHVGDYRYAASICLQALLNMGYTEEEVNPWKHEQEGGQHERST